LQVFFGEAQVAAISPSSMLLSLITFTLLPLSIGMVLRALFPDIAERAVEPIRKSVLYLMMIVLLLGVVSSYQSILDHFATAGGMVIAMNLITMAFGFGVARAFSLPLPQVITITFEVGVQNLALAFAITFNILQRPDLAVAALIYAAVMPATALGFVAIATRLMAKEDNSARAA
jgi:BASS family bile acid:Na+ symporter